MVKTENLCMNADFEAAPVERKSSTRVGRKESKPKVRANRNPFINFVQEFSRRAGVSGKQLISRAAERWRSMNESEKAPYCELARNAPRRRKKGPQLTRKKRSSRR
ncbi:hypothetical protein Zmor_009194 [Zophobas morio]|uniref:HMG box domain-containing protein n=1 Tax=Zophobas morio TaxID=2755281 RepID=A0AA38INQ1_9CUCU|nr:hypothetical protein Zmor_009194 [Zophobas morio]